MRRAAVLFLLLFAVAYGANPKCTACGKEITDEAIYYNGDKAHLYCRTCDSSAERCDACAQPLGAMPRTLSDGRRLCRLCLADGVFAADRATPIKLEVLASLDKLLGIRPPDDVNYQIVDATRLRLLLGGSLDMELGMCERDTNGAIMISILSGARRVRFIHALAHETAHAWVFANVEGELSQEVSEGFAEWVAYKVLERRGYDSEMRLMLARTDVYGRGLRRMIAEELRRGESGVVAGVRSGSLR